MNPNQLPSQSVNSTSTDEDLPFLPSSIGCLPEIELPGDGRPLSKVATEVGTTLTQEDVFNQNGIMMFWNDGEKKLSTMTGLVFQTQHAKYFDFINIKCNKRGFYQEPNTIKQADAKALVVSPAVLGKLRPLTHINRIRMPVFNGKKLRLLKPGYDAKTQVYTFAEIRYPLNIPLQEAKDYLDSLIAEFPFSDREIGKSILIGLMLTLYGRGLRPPLSIAPCFIVIGNKPGVGKGLLFEIGIRSVTGHFHVSSFVEDDGEMRKKLTSIAMKGDPVLVLDNIKCRQLNSPSLEAFLTGNEWEDRLLGANLVFAGAKDTVVVITGNHMPITPDLKRRSLIIELLEKDATEAKRLIKNPLASADILMLRPRVLGSLLSLIRAWEKAGCPRPSKTNTTFKDWNNVIGGILEHAGYESPFKAVEVITGGNNDAEDMCELIDGLPLGVPQSFLQIITFCMVKGLFDSHFEGCVALRELEKLPSVRSHFGKYLASKHQVFTTTRTFLVQGKGHGRTYTAMPRT